MKTGFNASTKIPEQNLLSPCLRGVIVEISVAEITLFH